MKVVISLVLVLFALAVEGSMLKCGEDIIVQRGEKKTLRFWSTDDELMKVEMIPVREQSDASALLAIFKNSFNQGPNIFETRDDILSTKSSMDGSTTKEETLYRIDDQILEKFNNHLLSRTELSDTILNNTNSTTVDNEETSSDHFNFTNKFEDKKIIKIDEYYDTVRNDDTTGQETQGNLQEYTIYDDTEEDKPIVDYNNLKEEVRNEENVTYQIDLINNLTNDHTLEDISSTVSSSDKITTHKPREEELNSKTVTSQITESSEMESTTGDLQSLLTTSDSDYNKEEIKYDDNNYRLIKTEDENTEETLHDLNTNPSTTEILWTTEEYIIQDTSNQNIETTETIGTNKPSEVEGEYELRHEYVDSTLLNDNANDITLITEPQALTTPSSFETLMSTEYSSEGSDSTTERISSLILSNENYFVENKDSNTQEKNSNQDLFSSNDIKDFIVSTTELDNNDLTSSLIENNMEDDAVEVTTSKPENMFNTMQTTDHEDFYGTTYTSEREEPTTVLAPMTNDADKEFYVTTEVTQDEININQEHDHGESHILFDNESEDPNKTVGKEELNDIISELKSQEALLSQPTGNDGSVEGVSVGDNSESVDIKLNILKNIIKGLTSEMASNDKTYTQREIENNMQQTYLIYPEEPFAYDEIPLTPNDRLQVKEPANSEITKGKIHIQDKFPNQESSILSVQKSDMISPSLNLLENSEMILSNISTSEEDRMKDPLITSNEQSLTTTEDQSTTKDLDITTTESSVILFELSNKTNSNSQVTKNSLAKETNQNHLEKDDLQIESYAEESPEKSSDLKRGEIEMPPVEELYIPLHFLGAFESKSTKSKQDGDEQAIGTDQLSPSDSKDEPNIRKSDSHDDDKIMRKEVMSLIDSTTVAYIDDNIETSTTKEISTITEIPDIIDAQSEDSIFSKETGSDSAVSLLRNSQLTTYIDDIETKVPEKEYNILLPINLFNSKAVEQSSDIYSTQKSNNQVLVKEQGSKVVIIKPNYDILKAQQEHDSTSLTLNTETGNYEVEIESTTSVAPELEETTYIDLKTLKNNTNDIMFENSEQNKLQEIIDSEQSSKTTQFQGTSKQPETKTEVYIPFGLEKEINPVDNFNSYGSPSPHALIGTSLNQELEGYNENESKLHEIQIPKSDSIVSTKNENYDYDDIYEFSHRQKDRENSYDNEYPEYGETLSNTEQLYNEYEVSDSEKLQRKINTKESGTDTSIDYLANHRISEPLPYLLQTRKGFVDADAPFIRAGNVQHRSDDSQQSFGEDSPFYIKLPGSKNAVPVFLQYEPVKVKYVNADKFFKKKPISENTELSESEMNNDLSSTFYKENIKDKNKIKDKPTLEQIAHMNVDLHLRPDPFYVMDAPNLANEKARINEENNEVDSFSINVEGKLGVQKEGGVPSVITGDKPIYPGEYFIKNPDNSYSSSDTSSLTNPVFSLGSKVTIPPREPGILQYTPFPLTTNPPKVYLPEEAENLIEDSDINISKNFSSMIPIVVGDVEEKFNYSTENPPSIEYSPIPSIDYPDSYGPFEYSDPLYNSENNDSKFYEDSENEFSSPYPEKAFITDSKTEKLIDGPLKKNSDFDIVALANFLHQNQKVWSNPKATPIPEGGLWRSPSWDDVVHSSEQTNDSPNDSVQLASPWASADESLGEERFYSAFHSPEDVPGIDPSFFSYRKMPKNIKGETPLAEEVVSRKKRSTNDQVKGILRYIHTLPASMQNAVINPTSPESKRINKRSATSAGEHVYCEWNIKTEPGLYLLVTFHNLSAPYTVDCYGAYIEVERENNGYDARWCGNRATIAGTRPHVIFAKSEVRITVYDNGDTAKTFPTGFEADIEVIDLFDSEDYKFFMEKKATPKIRKLMEG